MSGFKPFNPSGNGFNPTNDISIERLIEGVSDALTQNPTGTGFANAIQVEFGPAIGTGTDPVNLLADGELQINDARTYRIKIALQFGRIGQAGTSILLFRVTDDSGNQIGRSISALISGDDTDRYLENDTWLTLAGPGNFRFEVMRDSAGNNSGGLLATIPTDEGVGTWDDAPTAALRVERWIQTP